MNQYSAKATYFALHFLPISDPVIRQNPWMLRMPLLAISINTDKIASTIDYSLETYPLTPYLQTFHAFCPVVRISCQYGEVLHV